MAILNSVTNLAPNLGSANFYYVHPFPNLAAGGQTVSGDAQLPYQFSDTQFGLPNFFGVNQPLVRAGRIRVKLLPAGTGGTVQLNQVRGTDGTNTVLLYAGGSPSPASAQLEQYITFMTDLYLNKIFVGITMAGGLATVTSYAYIEMIWSV
jgi:hypothetical protein